MRMIQRVLKTLLVIGTVLLLVLPPSHGFKLTDLRVPHNMNMVRSSRAAAPRRPTSFQSVADLNKYLSDITDYYTVLGRPRFGKRSVRTQSLDDWSSDDLRRFLSNKDSVHEWLENHSKQGPILER